MTMLAKEPDSSGDGQDGASLGHSSYFRIQLFKLFCIEHRGKPTDVFIYAVFILFLVLIFRFAMPSLPEMQGLLDLIAAVS